MHTIKDKHAVSMIKLETWTKENLQNRRKIKNRTQKRQKSRNNLYKTLKSNMFKELKKRDQETQVKKN